jgi:hypothetical protein
MLRYLSFSTPDPAILHVDGTLLRVHVTAWALEEALSEAPTASLLSCAPIVISTRSEAFGRSCAGTDTPCTFPAGRAVLAWRDISVERRRALQWDRDLGLPICAPPAVDEGARRLHVGQSGWFCAQSGLAWRDGPPAEDLPRITLAHVEHILFQIELVGTGGKMVT